MRCALILLMAAGLWGQAAPYDVIISGARVVDGSGSPWYYADIGIRGDTIAAVGALGNAPAGVRIDAAGLVVAPGFIDIHSHGRRGIFAVPTAENYLREGVTTIVEGPDGSSPLPLAPFLDGIRQDADLHQLRHLRRAGHHPRRQVIGLANRKATARGNRKDEGARRASHARRRVRTFHRPVLRAGQFHAHRGSDRARQGGGQHGRHPHFAHARRGGARAGQRARDHPHRRGGRAADADHAPQDHRPAQLGPERGDAQTGGRGARARRGRDHRSVPLHRVEHRHRRAVSAMGARRRAEVDLPSAWRRRTSGRGSRRPSCENIKVDRGAGDPKNVAIVNCAFDRTLAGKNLAADHAGARRGADHRKRRRDRHRPA